MPAKTISSLSLKRIIISLMIFVSIPIAAYFLDMAVNQYAISLMFSMNIGTSALIVYDWNLFGIHYNRAKNNILNTILFTAVGMILIMLWVYVGATVLKANIVIPGTADLVHYGYARPGMFIAFSFMEAASVSISFKCLMDHIDVHGRELFSILFSGIVFGLLFTVLFLPSLDFSLFWRTYLYNIVLTVFLSFLYNQSHSILPGILAMSIVYFWVMFQSIV